MGEMFFTKLGKCSLLKESSLYNEENIEFVPLNFQGLLAPILVEIWSVIKE